MLRTVTIVDDATALYDVPQTWTGPLPVVKPDLLPPIPHHPRHRKPEAAVPDLEPALTRLRTAMAAERPVIAEVQFSRPVSESLRQDFACLPLFRQTVKACGGWAGLPFRRPTATGGKH